ncbi:MAG TPA: CGGC domain-containing protein [Kiritimatiellia bacterium]|nr:CGGC domain-containing protein [Kiritimatiellia bacterium]HPS09494.1 CGGC domain-containing protein [Kiritimatiellia bacterium]
MDKTYIVVVQCDIVMERCSGYFCEKAFHERSGGFADYPADRPYRTLYLTCGGCCGRGLHRKLGNLAAKALAKENIDKAQIVVHLSTCITRESYHGPPCPHLDYLKTLIAKLGLELREDTWISKRAAQRRAEGRYARGAGETGKAEG